MKTAKLTLMFLACTAAIPAFAQNTTDSLCGVTNFDRGKNLFTIVNPGSGTATQQCFINVVPKASWTGGAPDMISSKLVEGNYDIVLSGAGGGAGGGAGRDATRGFDGGDAVAFKATRYLAPGVYRLTIGTGGQAGQGCLTQEKGGRGADGGPTSVSNANSGETVAGFPRAEFWTGRYDGSYQVAAGRRTPGDDRAFDGGNMTPTTLSGGLASGGRAASHTGACDVGAQGGNGFIQLALADTVPQPARLQPVERAPAASQSQTVTTPAPAETRPIRRDRN